MSFILRNLSMRFSRIVSSTVLRIPAQHGSCHNSRYLTTMNSQSNNIVHGAEKPRHTIFGHIISLFGMARQPIVIQPCRTKARGNTYQPSVLKRIRKHGWDSRLKTKGGIKVILRRKLKGRKILA